MYLIDQGYYYGRFPLFEIIKVYLTTLHLPRTLEAAGY